jgi:hypothetical protein
MSSQYIVREKIVESFGNCRNWEKCGSKYVTLGNELCVHCWDLRHNKKGIR